MGLSAGAQNPFIPEPEAKSVDWKKRIASVWIPAILGLGLLVSFGYVGVRIVAGKPPAATPVVPKEAPAVVQPAAALPATAPTPPPKAAAPAAPALANFTVITPLPGEQYLQIAAVSPHMVLVYVDTLRQSNLEAVVAPGPTPDLLRILVGPFSDHDSMLKVKDQLLASGRSPIVRSY
jgi:cell division septation protein DedD